MTDLAMREVALWDAEVAWEDREDGSVLVWQKGELPDYPDRLSDRIEHWARTVPDRPWMAERGPDGAWHRITYGEMFDRIRAIGQALLNLGLSADKPLIILSGNSIAHALMALGAQYVGVPSAAVAPAYSLVSHTFDKLRSVADSITPGSVFADDLSPFMPAIEAVFPRLPRLGQKGEGLAMSWERLLATPVTGAVDEANAATGPDTVAKFLFTSGTTGSPKAVVQTQRMLCSNMAMVADCFTYLEDEPPVLLDWAPWNHVASGNKVFNMGLYLGGTFHIDGGRPTPDEIHETIRNLHEVSPNWYFNVPAGYDMLIEAMKTDGALAESFFRNAKLLMYAGAAMAAHTWQDLEKLAAETTGEYIFLTTGLGATETAPLALYNTERSGEPGKIGIPAREVTLKLVPNGDNWEARIKGPNVTPGYWRNDELTAAAFDEEGFFKLGDALRFADRDDPGKGFYFAGRLAENFKLATGTWVAVGALRAKLRNALGGLARDAVIVGADRHELGALLVPFRPAIENVVPSGAKLDDGALLTHPALVEEVRKRLAVYNAAATGSSLRVPRVMFLTEPLDLDKGEVTDKGSVNQRAVLNHRADLAATIYTGDPRVIVV